MYDEVYNSLFKYFNTLSSTGYIKDDNVYKLIYIIAIVKITNEYFPGYVTQEDYKEIENSLYNLFGTSYLIPYPKLKNSTDMNKLHLNDATDLINALNYQIEKQNKEFDKFKHGINEELYDVKKVKVLKSNEDVDIDVADIITN